MDKQETQLSPADRPHRSKSWSLPKDGEKRKSWSKSPKDKENDN